MIEDTLRRPRVTQTDLLPGCVKPRHFEKGLAAIKFGQSVDRPDDGLLFPIYFSLDTGVMSVWNGETWLTSTFV